MSIFNEFFKKEKPVFTGITRGIGGFGFGAAAGDGGGGDSGSVSPDGHTATGGIISDFDDGGTIYRSHTFITPGTFEVTALSTVYPAGIEYLVVAGGGGGGGSGYGSDGQGAGGAGGLRSNHPSVPAPLRGPAYNVSATTYTVEVGLGAFGGKHGGGGTNANNNLGRFGKDSNFYPSPVSYPSTAYIRAPGGGRGGAFGSSPSYRDGEPGGSGGGGAGGSAGAAGSGNQPTDPNWPQPVGNNGGARGPNYGAGGGGGFTGAGESADTSNNPGDGGAGINLTMESGTATGYAGGGAGGAGGPGRPDPGASHGVATHGGGSGGTGRPDVLPTYLGGNGRSGSGGGGGGSASGSSSGNVAYDGKGWGGGDGGPGIVVVRYQIGQKNSAKATGGAVSFYNNKVIHTFRNPGTFTATESLSCEVVLVGGGGGGGYQNAGGGGAGGYRVVTSHPVPAAGHAVTVGEHGVGLGNGPSTSPGTISALRNGGATTLATPSSLSVGGGGAGGNEGPGDGSAQGQVFPGPTGGSSGGGGRHQGTVTTSGPYGNDGGNGVQSPYVAGGGGGGAGGAGEDGEGPTSEGGHGGLGVQLPTTFRDPIGFKFAQGPDDSYYWVAGGGGGGSGNPGGSAYPRGGTGPSGAPSPRCGGGGGGTPYNYSTPSENRTAPNSQPGMMGTGGGGGGGGESVGPDPFAGPRAGSPGGSGILLIAYPA